VEESWSEMSGNEMGSLEHEFNKFIN